MSGVKPRFDGKGCEFGDMHRKLPPKCGMFDIDKMSGNFNGTLELRKAEVGFIEYRTDWNNTECNFIALFEVKHKYSEEVRKAMECGVGTATFAQKKLAEKIGARYFFVIANDGIQPFEFYEMIDDKFTLIGKLDYNADNRTEKVNEFWQKIGLL